MPSLRRNESLSVWTKSVDVVWKEAGLKNGVLFKTNENLVLEALDRRVKGNRSEYKKMAIITRRHGKPWRRLVEYVNK